MREIRLGCVIKGDEDYMEKKTVCDATDKPVRLAFRRAKDAIENLRGHEIDELMVVIENEFQLFLEKTIEIFKEESASKFTNFSVYEFSLDLNVFQESIRAGIRIEELLNNVIRIVSPEVGIEIAAQLTKISGYDAKYDVCLLIKA